MNKIHHNSRTTNDIDITLGSVANSDKRNTEMSKILTETKNITYFLLIKTVPFFNTNNFAELLVLPAIELSFNTLPR